MIDYSKLRNRQFEELKQAYTWKDCVLYALSIGVGADPLDPHALRFLQEHGTKAFPTMPVVLAHPGFWLKDEDTGVDWVRVVHGEQRLRVHSPLCVPGTVKSRTVVTAVVDKGPGKGALIVSERTLIDAHSDRAIATIQQTAFARGDGGFSNDSSGDTPPAPLVDVPRRPADIHFDVPTRRDAAIMYRLNGDLNPIHVSAHVAKKAGFERPILHGLCTFGAAAHAIVRCCCRDEPDRLVGLNARFSAAAYPGDTLRTEIWNNRSRLQFQTVALERHVTVLSHGEAELSHLLSEP